MGFEFCWGSAISESHELESVCFNDSGIGEIEGETGGLGMEGGLVDSGVLGMEGDLVDSGVLGMEGGLAV